MYKVADIRQQLIDKYQLGWFRAGTVELQAVSFEADEPFFFKPPNQDYIRAELEWYASQNLNVDALANLYGERVKIWDYVCDTDMIINSNYGYLIYSPDNNRQYQKVLWELKRDPMTRRAVMIYTNPGMHEQATENGRNDFVCTNTVQYFLNGLHLDAIVNMRSNDVFFGYSNDYAWQLKVLKDLAQDLGVRAGRITWQVGSLHVYERHYSWLH